MDVERIKRGTYLTEKYFDEQLERIREIRASERKFYQKVTDLYATAIDYDRTAAAGMQLLQNAFMQQSRIKCTLPSTVTPQLSLS